MSQRFIRCPHCGLPHDDAVTSCPTTGAPIERRRFHSSAPPAPPSSSPPNSLALPPPPPPSGPSSRPPTSRPPQAAALPSMPPPAGPPDRRRLIGTVVGGVYKVKAMLGQGGMASVYEAEQMPMGRDVALKVLALDRSIGDEPWKRFLLEARAAASLSHPNICQVFDFGELEDKSPFYTMERLVGEPLSERIARDNALGFVDVVDILMQILAGLAAAHKKNIVHRDIKPENVFLIVRDGRPPLVKLLDFGVSKIVAPDEGEDITQITRTGIVMGTPYYMAPEQAYGGRDFDARVDLWSAGVIFYEAIVGRRPFTANNYAALLNAIIREPHKPVRDLRPGTPIEVQMVIDKALSKAREDRYQSATAFMGDLQRLRERLARMGLVPGSSSKLPVVPPAPPGEDEGHR